MSQDRPPRLRANLAWMVMGTAVNAGLMMGVTVVLAKLGTPEVVGYFYLGLAYTAPVVSFFNMNLRVVQATDTQRDFPFSSYAGHRALGGVLSLVTIGLFLALPMHDLQTRVVTGLIALAKAVELGSDVLYGLFQRLERMSLIAISTIMRGVSMFGLMALAFWWTESLAWALVAQVVAWGLVFSLYDLPNGRAFVDDELGVTPRFQTIDLLGVTKIALPLGVSVLLGSLYLNLPRYFISEFATIYDVGIFSALANLPQIEKKIVQAVGQTMMPRLAQQFQARKISQFLALSGGATVVVFLVAVAGVGVAKLGGSVLLTWLYDSEYGEYATLFAVIMAAGGMGSVTWLLANVLNATRWFRSQVPLAMLTIGVCIIGCLMFSEQGVLGVAWAWLLAEVVQMVCLCALIGSALYLRASHVD